MKNLNGKDQQYEPPRSNIMTKRFPQIGATRPEQNPNGAAEVEESQDKEEQQLLLKEVQQKISLLNLEEDSSSSAEDGQTRTNIRPTKPKSNSSSNLLQKQQQKRNSNPNSNHNDDNHQSNNEAEAEGFKIGFNGALNESDMPTSPLKHGAAKLQQITNPNSEESRGHQRSSSKTDEYYKTPSSNNFTVTRVPVNADGYADFRNGGGLRRTEPANEVYKGPKWWQSLVRKWPSLSLHLAMLAIFLALWSVAYFIFPDYAEPTTAIMRLVFLIVGAQIAGLLVSLVYLPDMLGMLFFGVIYTNVGLADFSGYQRLEAFLREMALINIMLLAGLGLDSKAFKKVYGMICRLTLIPTIAEVGVIAFLAYFTLKMPLLFCVALGLVVTAVSPNVVVTVMLKLKEERLGLNSGIHTLIYAMTTCNDVVAIFLFGVIAGVIYPTGSLTEQLLQGPIGIGIGVVFGSLYGIMLTFLPSKNSSYTNGVRFVLTTLGGVISVIGSKTINYPSAGALGCVALAYVANLGWKKEIAQMTPEDRKLYQKASVAKRLDLLWKFLKPVSFALIGKEINFGVLEGKVVGYGTLLVIVGSLFRLAFAYISTCGGNLTRKERAYITISGIPKATVQAAIGPILLDMAREKDDNDTIPFARNILIISVLAIIFTAPLGAILMIRLAPFCLKRSDSSSESLDTNPDTELGNRQRPNNA